MPRMEYDTRSESARGDKESGKISWANTGNGKRDQKDTPNKHENKRRGKMETSFTETI